MNQPKKSGKGGSPNLSGMGGQIDEQLRAAIYTFNRTERLIEPDSNAAPEELDGFEDYESHRLPPLHQIPHEPDFLALIAALIDPNGCLQEDVEPALTQALHLSLKSAMFSQRIRSDGSILPIPRRIRPGPDEPHRSPEPGSRDA